MMSSTEPAGIGPPKLHRLFTVFDPEATAVVSILLGLFQVLLALPIYYMNISLIRLLFLVPLCIGIMIVIAGSFAVACEKSPNRQLLKGCAYSNMASLLGALVAVCLYGYAMSAISFPSQTPCHKDDEDLICPPEMLVALFRNIGVLLLVYDIAALVLHCLLSLSALKGLKVL